MSTGNKSTWIFYARSNYEGSKWVKIYPKGESEQSIIVKAIVKSAVIQNYWRQEISSDIDEQGYITWFYKKGAEYGGEIASWNNFKSMLFSENAGSDLVQRMAGPPWIPSSVSATTYKCFSDQGIWYDVFWDMNMVRGLLLEVEYPGSFEDAPDIYDPGTMSFMVFGSGIQEEADRKAKEESGELATGVVNPDVYTYSANKSEVDLTEYVKGQENPFADPSLTAFSELRGDVEANQDLVRFYKGNTNLREFLGIGSLLTSVVGLGAAASVASVAGTSLALASNPAGWIAAAVLGAVGLGLGIANIAAEAAYRGKSEEEKRIMESYEFSYREFLDANVMAGVDSEASGKSQEEKLADHERLKKYVGEGGPGKRARQLRREAYEMYGDPRDRSSRRWLRVSLKDLRNRRRAIELLLPEIITQAVYAWPEETLQERYEKVKSASFKGGSRYEDYWDKEGVDISRQAIKELKLGLESYDVQKLSLFLPFEVSAAIKRLMVSLLGQPNTAFLAYDFLKDRYNEDKLNREAVKSINEYVDQSYWRFVPDDAALENWKIVLHDKSPDLPDEPVFRFKKSAGNDPWMAQLLKISRTISASGKNPAQLWLEKQNSEGKADLESIKNELIAPAEEDINQLSIPDSSVGPALPTPGIEQTSQPQQAKVNLSGADLVSGLEQLSAELEVTGGEGAQLELSVDMGEPYAAVEAGPPAGSDGAALPQMPSITIEEGVTFEGQRGGGYLIRAEVELEDLRRLFEKAEDYLPEGERFSTTEARISGAEYQAPPPQVVYKFDKGSVQIHTQKISPERLGNVFIDFLRQYSQVQ